jgi:DNA-binding response OmpR family regulator
MNQSTSARVRILVVEDEESVSSFLRSGLEKAFYEVDVVANGDDALHAVLQSRRHYGVIILDLVLPDRHGLTVVDELRERGSTVKILALTAHSSVEERVTGLDRCCDDYLCKPFAFEELLARLRSLQRRSDYARASSQLMYAGLTLNPLTRRVSRDGKTIDLTNRQFALLDLLLRYHGVVLKRDEIVSTLWGWEFEVGSNVLNVHINMLRKKIDQGFSRPLLHTVHGIGYKLE